MSEILKPDRSSDNQYYSKEFFNSTWDLIDKAERTPREIEKMIHLSHASLCHWLLRPDCTDQNLSIGYWHLSRVYAVAQEPQNALKYGKLCLDFSLKDDVEKIYLAFAYEAIARSYALLGESVSRDLYLKKAKELSEQLKVEDKKQILGDLLTIK